MSDVRRPTTRLNARNKKDLRVDTVPPPPASKRSAPPPGGRPRMSEGMLPRVDGRRFPVDEPKTAPLARLEDRLARERAERDADADKMGELLARVARAESERQRLGERVAELENKLAQSERDKASLEAQIATGRRKEATPNLVTARAIANELTRVLERIRDKPTLTDLPAPKSTRG